MLEKIDETTALVIGTALGGSVSAIIAALANFIVSLRKQPFDQAMIMVGSLQARVDALEADNKRCQQQHAEQQLELGELREEVSYLRRQLKEHEDHDETQSPPQGAR